MKLTNIDSTRISGLENASEYYSFHVLIFVRLAEFHKSIDPCRRSTADYRCMHLYNIWCRSGSTDRNGHNALRHLNPHRLSFSNRCHCR